MEVKPPRSYRKPRYPQKSQVSRDPSLLRRVPHRWAKSAAALTALGMTLSLGACSLADAGPEARDGSQTGQSGQTETGGPAAPAGADSLAAPIFLHGGGSGSFGCVSVVAPYFLSEEEAFEIIRSEAEAYGGLTFSAQGPAIDDVVLPQTYLETRPDDALGQSLAQEGVNGQLLADGAAESGAAFEFVSSADLSQWQWSPTESNRLLVSSSVSTYAFKETAEFLRESLADAELSGPFAVFYDPYSYTDLADEYEAIRQESLKDPEAEGPGAEVSRQKQLEAARGLSEENLRAQVRDFIDWLKGQGMI